MIELRVIVLSDNPRSVESWERLRASHLIHKNGSPLSWFEGIPAHRALAKMEGMGLLWGYPTAGVRMVEGLKLTPYKGLHSARVGCALSHLLLWRHCVATGLPVVVMEDDCQWVRSLQVAPILESPYGMVSLNNPLGATRCAVRYHVALQAAKAPVVEVPWVDDDRRVPQGLPGHSAYVIKPHFAEVLIRAVGQLGLWPNDAIACRQLFPGQLGCSTTYFTTIQRRPSLMS